MIELIIIIVIVVLIVKQAKTNKAWKEEKAVKSHFNQELEKSINEKFSILDQGYNLSSGQNVQRYAQACQEILSECRTLYFDTKNLDQTMPIYQRCVKTASKYRYLKAYYDPQKQTTQYFEHYDNLGLWIQETLCEERNGNHT